MAAPGWQTSELDEEWPDQSLPGSTRHPFSPAASSSSQSPSPETQTHSVDRYGTFKSIGSGRPSKPSTTPFRVVSGHTHNSLGSLLAAPPVGSTPLDAERERRRTSRLSPPNSAGGSEGERKSSSCTSQDDERETSFEPPAGTFLVKETEDERPKHLRNPFIAKPGGGLGAGGGGGSLFQPLALESMFKPPSPSAEDSSVRSVESPPRSTSPTEPVPTALDTTGSRGSLRRTSHSYVPARPSRLSESMSPELTRSESSSHQSVDDQEEALEELASLSPASQAGSSQQREEPRRFSGRMNSMQDISFTFSPRRDTSPQAPLAAGIDVATPPSKASLKLFSLRESVAVYPVNDERGLETPLVSAGRKQRAEHRNTEGVTSWQSEEDLVKRGERKLQAHAAAGTDLKAEQDEEEHEEGETSTDEEMKERKPKRIRLDSPSVDSDSSQSRFAEAREQSPDYRSPASFGHQDQSTPRSFASSESPASLNDTQRLQFHMGLISPVPRDGLYAAGNRQSWEQRGSAMLQLVRNQFQYEGDASQGGMVSPSTITNSGSEQTPESAGRRDSTFEGTVRERSESHSPQVSLSPPGLSQSIHSSKSGPSVMPNNLGSRLTVTGTSSTNTAIYVGPDRNATRTSPQTASSATVRAALGINGTVNSQSSGSGGTVTTSGSGSTVTSKYLSEGMNIMDRIRERKCSESSGTMTGPDHEADAISSSSAGRSTSALSNHRTELGAEVAREDSAADMRRSRMASLRAEQGQDRQVRPVASSSSLSATSTGSSRPTIAPLDRPPTLAPLPASADDLNRFISAATTTTYNTANTAASTSFVKHRGPPMKPRGLHSMGLEDIPQIPAQVGKMIFDRQQSKWVRAPNTRGFSGIMEEGESSEGEGSLDIFAGLESLRDDRATQNGSFAHVASEGGEMPSAGFNSMHEDALHGDGARSLAKTTVEEDSSSAHELQRVEECVSLDDVQVEVDEYSLRMSISTSRRSQGKTVGEDLAAGQGDLSNSQATHNDRPHIQHTQSDPTPILETSIIGVTPLRSVTRGVAGTPVSAMRKSTSQRQSTNEMIDSATKRNVSFSDGKRPGRTSRSLQDRSDNGLKHRTDSLTGDIFGTGDAAKTQAEHLQSIRSKRINNMLQGIENETLGHATPTKVSRALTPLISDSEGSADGSIEPHETDSDSGHVPSRTGVRNQGDATFLTECSFAVSHDKLVQIITEVQPFEPYWEELTAIDLSKRGATSVARLKEFLPKLDVVDLSDNQISYLSGIPSTVRTLSAAGNKISSLTAINHLQNIQYLDLSRNDLDGVNALSCLRHLREVKLDHNRITDLGDLLQTDSLVKISCSNNRIAELDLRQAKWPRLEMLDLSNNRLTDVLSLERLVNLVSLNLDGNELAGLEAAVNMSNLRVLRLSNNRLLDFDLSMFTRLRTLYADNNRLHQLSRTNPRSLTRLENLSLRNQRGASLKLSYEDLRDVKRLYISGNPLATDFFPEQALYSLAYLEAAACKLSTWPRNFAQRMPNLRHVNLNYNFLEDLKGLSGLQGLRKLSLIGARLGETGSREIISDLRGLGTLESVDIRMNPCTLNYYLPIIVTSTAAFCAAESQNNAYGSGSPSWASMDINFRRSLPDEWYSKRLLYRGLMTMACEQIDMIDGIRMTSAERTKARQLMESALRDDL